jgi:hypothetical protein
MYPYNTKDQKKKDNKTNNTITRSRKLKIEQTTHSIVILSMFYQKESYTNITQIVLVVDWKVSG